MALIRDNLESEGLTDTKSFRTQAQVLATANSTLTLTAASEHTMLFTGTTAGQIVKFGDATTYKVGHWYVVHNNSTQNIDIQDNGANVLVTIGANQRARATLQANGTTNGTWSFEILATGAVAGGAGINFGFDGNAVSGRWLESNTNIASNLTGITIPTATYIKAISIACENTSSTITFGIYGSTAAINAAINPVQKTTVALTTQRKKVVINLNVPIAASEEIGVKVESGSCSRPVVTIYIQ